MKNIGNNAFDRCANLMTVHVASVIPIKISSGTFSKGTEKEGTLYVKQSAYDAYSQDKQWRRFLNIVKE